MRGSLPGYISPRRLTLGHFGRRLQQRTLNKRGLLTQSYARGPTEVRNPKMRHIALELIHKQPPLIETTVGEHFASVVRQHGDNMA